MNNAVENRLFAYQQYTQKLEKTIKLLALGATILLCIVIAQFGYIAWITP